MNIRIRECRKAAGMSQTVLAAKIGICQSQISRIERGRYEVTVTRLAAIAKALNVPITELFDSEVHHAD